MPIKSLATGTLLSRTGQDGVSTPAELTIWKCFLCSKVNSKEVEKCLCCGRPKEFAPKSSVYPKKARPFALHGLVSLAEDIRPEQIQSLCQQGQLDINQTDSVTFYVLFLSLGYI
jgi:hypothetical protein